MTPLDMTGLSAAICRSRWRACGSIVFRGGADAVCLTESITQCAEHGTPHAVTDWEFYAQGSCRSDAA